MIWRRMGKSRCLWWNCQRKRWYIHFRIMSKLEKYGNSMMAQLRKAWETENKTYWTNCNKHRQYRKIRWLFWEQYDLSDLSVVEVCDINKSFIIYCMSDIGCQCQIFAVFVGAYFWANSDISYGIFWNLAASGLNSGYSMNWRNKFANLWRNPYNDFYGRPLSSIFAYLSINSTIYLVKLQSHSLTVHFVFNKISSLSSVEIFFILSPLYKSISYFALIVKGVWTYVTLPSDFLKITNNLPCPLLWVRHVF